MPGQLEIVAVDSALEAEWRQFVAGTPEATLAHSFNWRRVLQRTYGNEPLYLAALRGGAIEGVLPLVHMRGFLAPNRLVSLPYLDTGGVLAQTPDAQRLLHRRALDLIAERKAKGLDLRGGVSLPEAPAASQRFRFILDLPSSEDDLWKAIGPKVRNQIRKSEKEHLTSRKVERAGLQDFYRIFARNMRDLGSPVHSLSFFSEILDVFRSEASLYLTFNDQGRPVAGAMALRFGQTAVVPWASSRREARPACPNHSLYWRILRDVRDDGMLSFDFGRSSTGTGTYHFKKQWRAEARPLHWSLYDQRGKPQPEAYFDPRKNAKLAAAWRRMPLPVAGWFGPIIRGRLPN